MKIGITIGLLAALTVSAQAADIPRPVYKAVPMMAAYNWSGFYAGVNAGWGQNAEDTIIQGVGPVGSTLINMGLIPNRMDPRQSGAAIGGQVGWRQQMGGLVYGVDAEFNWSNIKGDLSDTFTLQPLGLNASLVTTTNSELNWYGTVAGTVGFAFDRLLLYVKGGLAYGDVENTVGSTLSTPIPGLRGVATGSFGGTEFGYVIGGGIEAALVGNWTVGAEYTYLDLGTHNAEYSTSVLGAKVGFLAERENTFHLVKARLNYRF